MAADAEEGDLDLSGVEIEFVNDQDNPDDNMEAESEMEGSPPPVRQTAEPVRRTMGQFVRTLETYRTLR